MRFGCVPRLRLVFVFRSLEVQHNSGDALVVILCLVEKRRVYPISFHAKRQPRVYPEIHSRSGLRHQRIPAHPRRLRLQVASAHQRVSPRLPPCSPSANPYPSRASK